MTSGTAAPHGCRGMEPCPACNSAGCTRPLPNAPAMMDAEFVVLVEDVAGLVYPPFRGWQEWKQMRQERLAALWQYLQRREARARAEVVATVLHAASRYTTDWMNDPSAETRGQMVAADAIAAIVAGAAPPSPVREGKSLDESIPHNFLVLLKLLSNPYAQPGGLEFARTLIWDDVGRRTTESFNAGYRKAISNILEKAGVPVDAQVAALPVPDETREAPDAG